MEQTPEFTVIAINEQRALKQEVYLSNRHRCEEMVHPLLSLELQQAREFASLKEASSWLNVPPIDEHGFSLHKSNFQDAVCLQYGWPLPHLPTECICGTSFTVKHAFTCSHGGDQRSHSPVDGLLGCKSSRFLGCSSSACFL